MEAKNANRNSGYEVFLPNLKPGQTAKLYESPDNVPSGAPSHSIESGGKTRSAEYEMCKKVAPGDVDGHTYSDLTHDSQREVDINN